jgi:hypothetical protein
MIAQGYRRSRLVQAQIDHARRRNVIPPSVQDRPKSRIHESVPIVDMTRNYQRIVFAPNPNALGLANGQTFQVSGDHLYVEEINGGDSIYCSLGKGLSFFRINEGETIQRRFDQVTLKPSMATTGVNTAIVCLEATLYASYGPFRERSGEKSRAFKPGFLSWNNAVASTVIRNLFQDYFDHIDAVDPGVTHNFPFGKGGATLIIRNEDLANLLKVVYSNKLGVSFPGGANGNFKLYPGETITLDLDGRMFTPDLANGTPESLSVFTDAGNCVYGWMLSQNNSDPFDVRNS